MPSGIYKRKPFSKKHRENIGKMKIGDKNPAKRSEVRKKIRRTMMGKHNSVKTEFKKGNKRPKEWIEIQRIKISGKNNCNWKGGKLYYRSTILSKEWNKIRRKCYKRDNWTCQRCGRKDKPVQAHHIIPFRWWINIKWADSLVNLITFCISCHMKEEKLLDKIGRQNKVIKIYK